MKYLQILTVAALAVFTVSCSALEAPDRSATFQLGSQEITAGDIESDSARVLSIEAEFGDRADESGIQSVVGISFSGGETEDVELGQQTFDVDTDTLSAHAGVRWRPSSWDYMVRPFLGGGLAYLDLEVEAPLETIDDSNVGHYYEAGLEWKTWSVVYRHLDGGEMDLGPAGKQDVEVDQIMLGWSVSF